MSRNQAINTLIARIARRAEQNDPESLARTFVPIEPVSAGLRSVDHQVVYGRRGTGKTHTFRHLAHELEADGDVAVYIDLRTIGSSAGLYSDVSQSLALRGTRLLVDVLESIHTQLLDQCVTRPDVEPMFEHLDSVVEAATQVRVAGPMETEEEHEDTESASSGRNAGLSATVAPTPTLGATLGRNKGAGRSTRNRRTIKTTGEGHPHVKFGPLSRALSQAVQSIRPRRVWILLDEWSSIPLDLQPLLADLIRRSVFPCRNITVKIGAIERRSNFYVRGTAQGDYLGMELGADTAAALNLDEHLLVQENDSHAIAFFSRLIFNHINDLLEGMNKKLDYPEPTALVNDAFELGALSEFVRAAEGVPRDALNILGLAASRAQQRPISVPDIQVAARQYYLRDKEIALSGNPSAARTWARIQQEVVQGRRSRTFLISRNTQKSNAQILDLYDARLIHLLKAGLASTRRPGVLFDGYAVDYGTYIDALAQEEMDAIWDSRSRPWFYQKGQALLPDRFDESVIFNPDRKQPGQSSYRD